MGQYYKVIILAEKSGKKEFIRLSLNPSNYNKCVKLIEHSYIDYKIYDFSRKLHPSTIVAKHSYEKFQCI